MCEAAQNFSAARASCAKFQIITKAEGYSLRVQDSLTRIRIGPWQTVLFRQHKSHFSVALIRRSLNISRSKKERGPVDCISQTTPLRQWLTVNGLEMAASKVLNRIEPNSLNLTRRSVCLVCC